MKLIEENIFLKTISLQQTSPVAKYLVVFCHGYGADGKDSSFRLFKAFSCGF